MKSIFPIHAKGTNLLISALLISSSVLIANAPVAIAQYGSRYPYPNPGMPAPTPSLNGVWRVNWQVNGNYTSGRLYMQGNRGILRLRVRDRYGNMERIEQTMFLSPRRDGFALRGGNPIFTSTGIPVPNYLRIRQTPNGWMVTTCDDNRNCVPAMMQYIGSETVY
ncbi:hypothetical protein ACE1B6_04140 [Aerosakkonemataceae cyanobacterium BLCC-F154]|uniref:Secreted protein n=1 Tax=Floridaenema fluviatile BLCC-F154 TaxID=3153640 RepID=A0ABV4Y6L7_9CYAN